MRCPDEQLDGDSLPENAITHGEAVAILAGQQLREGAAYSWWGDQLRAAAGEGGLDRTSRAEVEAFKARLAVEGITSPSSERARLVRARCPAVFGRLTAEEFAELADVGISTVCMWAADPESGVDAVKVRGRWYFDPDKVPGRRKARPEEVDVPCSGECGGRLTVWASELRKVRRHYCQDCDPDGTRAIREGAAAAREVWEKLAPHERRARLSEAIRDSYRKRRRNVEADAWRKARTAQTQAGREAALGVLRALWKDRGFRARWLLARHNSTAAFGALGGHPRRSPLDDEPEILEDIRTMHGRGLSAQNIAQILSSRYRERITRKMVRRQISRLAEGG